MSTTFILREEDEGVLEDDDVGVDVSLDDSSDDDFPCFPCSNPVKELTSTEKSPVKKRQRLDILYIWQQSSNT